MKMQKLSILLFLSVVFISCKSQSPDEQSSNREFSENIQVYYFHNTQRCATCNAVENETKKALNTFFKEKVGEGVITFTSLNLEDDETKVLAKQLEVAGQTLLIVKGKTKINLTNEGFMNARNNPEKFHAILRQKIDKLI